MWKLAVVTVWLWELGRVELGKRKRVLSFEDTLDRVAALGFDGAEIAIWDVNEFSKERRMVIKEKIDMLGLEIPSACSNDCLNFWPGAAFTNPDKKIREAIIERVSKTIEAVLDWNCKIVTIFPPEFLPLKVRYWDAWNRFITTLSMCVDLAEGHDVTIALEYKPRTILNNADATLRAINQIGSKNLKVTLDTGHTFIAKEHLPTVVEMFKELLVHVHINDNYGDLDIGLPPGVVHNFEGFFQALKNINYRGYISLDIGHDLREDPDEVCNRGKEYIENMTKNDG